MTTGRPDVRTRPATPDDVVGTRRVLALTRHDTFGASTEAERAAEITGRWHAAEALGRQRGGRMLRSWSPSGPGLSSGTLSRASGRQLAAVIGRRPRARRARLQVEADDVKGSAFGRGQGLAAVERVTEDGRPVPPREPGAGSAGRASARVPAGG